MSEEEEKSMRSSLESDIAPSSPYPIRSPGKVFRWNFKKNPNFDLARHQIVFLSGLPGSGKSSTGRALAALFNEFNIFAIRTKFWLQNNLDFFGIDFYNYGTCFSRAHFYVPNFPQKFILSDLSTWFFGSRNHNRLPNLKAIAQHGFVYYEVDCFWTGTFHNLSLSHGSN